MVGTSPPAIPPVLLAPLPDASPTPGSAAGLPVAPPRDRGPRRNDHRPAGTVYGGPPRVAVAGRRELDPTIMTMPVSMPLENSGSLTGHILAQGWADTPPEKGSTAKVMLVLLVGLGLLVAVGLLVVLIVGDTFSSLFGGLVS